ncbi:MAG TPA: 3-hydroxyacyl-CoA dehydrogenase NAD-binding domain-containing protein, partial [Thermodesulfovibrionales bacterium]|nr:3-hydroxyacyl-CoA dehydrogenase NAD-binding domain-containing protein [Thermodesulfovibrionales bacterium]
MEIRTIAVIGAGTMGSGIAQMAAQSGYEVVMKDVKDEYVRNGFTKIKERLEKRAHEGKLEIREQERVLSNIRITTSL